MGVVGPKECLRRPPQPNQMFCLGVVYMHMHISTPEKKLFRRFLGIFLLARWIGLPEPDNISKDGLL